MDNWGVQELEKKNNLTDDIQRQGDRQCGVVSNASPLTFAGNS